MKELNMMLNDLAELEILASKIIRDPRKLTDIVHFDNRKEHYLIDTSDVIDYYETMVFACDAEGNVEKWSDLDCETYSTWEEAQKGHLDMIDKWKAKGTANKVVELKADDPRYAGLIGEIENANEDSYIIIARSDRNKPDSSVAPIEVRNGISFYVALDLGEKVAFLGNVTPEQIEKAKRNTVDRAIIGDMMEVLYGNGTTAKEWLYDDEQMIVLTSEKKLYGAGILFCDDFLDSLKGKGLGDFFILPSSLHEVLLVPEYTGFAVEDLSEMVSAVNREQVMPQERLSDHVHYYDRVHHLLINTHDGAAVSKDLDNYREEYVPKEKKQDLPEKDTPKMSRPHKRRGR